MRTRHRCTLLKHPLFISPLIFFAHIYGKYGIFLKSRKFSVNMPIKVRGAIVHRGWEYLKMLHRVQFVFTNIFFYTQCHLNRTCASQILAVLDLALNSSLVTSTRVSLVLVQIRIEARIVKVIIHSYFYFLAFDSFIFIFSQKQISHVPFNKSVK